MRVYKEEEAAREQTDISASARKPGGEEIPSMPLSLSMHVCGFWIRL